MLHIKDTLIFSSEENKESSSNAQNSNVPEVVVLPGGLTLIFSINTNEKVSWEVCVRAGYANSLADGYGLAHFVEHLLCRQADLPLPYKSLEDRSLSSLEDFYFSAYTAPTCTVYRGTVPDYDVNSIIEMLGKMFSNPSFKNIELEKNVCKTEVGKYIDDPWWELGLLESKASFDIELNNKEDIVGKEVSLDTIKEFIKKHYTQSNMILYVEGNVNKDHLLKKIGKEFGSVSSKIAPFPNVITWSPSLQIVKKDITEIYYTVIYNLPRKTLKDFLLTNLVNTLWEYVVFKDCDTPFYSLKGSSSHYYGLLTLKFSTHSLPEHFISLLEKICGFPKRNLKEECIERFNELKNHYADHLDKYYLSPVDTYVFFGGLTSKDQIKALIKSITWEDIESFNSYLSKQKPALAVYGNISPKLSKQLESFYSTLG